jgi:lipid-binding SYLF domain-containing protein
MAFLLHDLQEKSERRTEMFLRDLKAFIGMAVVLSIAGPPAAQAAQRAVSEQQELVNGARVTFSRFRDDPDLTGFREHERDARGYLIVPRAWRVGLVFGGSGGRGVLVSRGRTGDWNGPSFYTLGTASFGLQAGVDVSDIVVLVMTQRGMNALLSPSVRLGMDASVAAGPVGAGAGRPARPDTDFLYYSRSKGFYGGVSLEGAMIRPADHWNAAYYGRPVSPRDILVRVSVRNPGSRGLLETIDGSFHVVARR